MADNSKAIYRRTFTRKRIWERRMQAVYHEAILSIGRETVSRINSGKPMMSVQLVANVLSQRTKSAYQACANDAIRYGLETVQEQFGRPLPLMKANIPGFDSLGIPTVVNTVVKEGMEKVTDISQTIVTKLKGEQVASIAAHESRQQLAARIQGVMELESTWRAMRIAQTETTKVFNRGTFEGFKLSRVVAQKKWVTNIMGNPRPAHVAAHMQTVDVDKPFMVWNESLMYPGDPAGSVKNLVWCYCAMNSVIGPRKPMTQVAPGKPVGVVLPEIPFGEGHAGLTDLEWSYWAEEPESIYGALAGDTNVVDNYGHKLNPKELKEAKLIGRKLIASANSNSIHQTVVYRGESYATKKEIAAKYKIDGSYSTNRLTSTGLTRDIAEEYATTDAAEKYPVILRFTSTNNIRGVQAAPLGIPGTELVMPEGLKFRVLGITNENKFTIVHLYSEAKLPKSVGIFDPVMNEWKRKSTVAITIK